MSSNERPDLSVIIVNRNTRALLRDCLASIEALPDRVRVETIVVDNGSSDGSAEMVSESFPAVRLIMNAENTGYAYPNNQGLKVSEGRYLLLLNSDTVVKPGAFERLVSFMDEHPEAGACGPKLLFPGGELQRSCRSFPTNWEHFCDMAFLDRIFPESRWFGNMETWFDHDRTAEVDQPMGAALMVRREVYDSIGGLDERFKIYYNDVDWCYRIRGAGWKIYFVHEAEIVHYQGVTTRNENQKMQLNAEMMQNVFDYFRKHYGPRGLRWFRTWMVLGFATRRLMFFLPDAVMRSETGRYRGRLFRGHLRAAWTGNPDQFVSEAN